jgi:hypothetical protein
MLAAARRGTGGDRDGIQRIFVYLGVCIQSNPICLGFVPIDIHAQTASTHLNPQPDKSIYTLHKASLNGVSSEFHGH